MIPATQTPYNNLNPDVILNALEAIGFLCTGSLLALNSYENRVYQIGIEDANPVIAKFYRPNRWSDDAILEEHAFAAELKTNDIPVVAPLVVNNKTLHHFEEFRFAVFPRQGGRPLELDNLDQLEWMGRFIGRVHAVGAVKPFQHRITLNVQNYGYDSYQFLLEHQFIPDYLKHNLCLVIDDLLQKTTDIFQLTGEVKHIRLHGDCHAGNVLWNDRGPQIVDLDDCLMGPSIQDIWMLLSGDRAQVNLQLDLILEGYQEFADFNYRELHLIEALRALRMLHHAAWLARRWNDPAFPLNFPWFNTPRYWEQQMQHFSEQVNLLESVLEKL